MKSRIFAYMFSAFAVFFSHTSFAQCTNSWDGRVKTCCLTYRKTGDVHCCSTEIKTGKSLGCTVNGQRTDAVESSRTFDNIDRSNAEPNGFMSEEREISIGDQQDISSTTLVAINANNLTCKYWHVPNSERDREKLELQTSVNGLDQNHRLFNFEMGSGHGWKCDEERTKLLNRSDLGDGRVSAQISVQYDPKTRREIATLDFGDIKLTSALIRGH